MTASAIEGPTHRSPDNGPDAGAPTRIAGIDVGSNTVRLVIGQVEPDGRVRVIDDEKEPSELGRAVFATGRLEPDAIERTAETIARFAEIARGFGADPIEAVATSAVRDASNADEFTSRVRALAGVDCRVISAEEDATLSFRGAAASFDLSNGPVMLADLGGGSLELVLAIDGEIVQTYPLRLGAVRLTGQFGGPAACAADRYKDLLATIDDTLARELATLPFAPRVLLGTGGTFTTLAAIAAGPLDQPQGAVLTRQQVRGALDLVRRTPVGRRTRIAGLGKDRAEIILAGTAVVDRLLSSVDLPELIVHRGGVRTGLLEELADRLPARASRPRSGSDPVAASEELARRLNADLTHAAHVAGLADAIWSELRARAEDPGDPPGAWTTAEARLLLRCAAILHDCGYAIGHEGHHRHADQIILHASIAGLDARQRCIVASLARTHRRSEPKASHPSYAALDERDRAMVDRLSAILRFADGLDRTHRQAVRTAGVHLDASRVRVTIVGAPGMDLTTDAWGAMRKSGPLSAWWSRAVEVTPRESSPG